MGEGSKALRYDLVILGAEVMTPGGLRRCDLAVRAGRIAGLGDFSASEAAEAIEAKGLTVLPGIIDTQVHFREPGGEHKEDLASGTAAAALGGVTAVFEMPNTNPTTTTAEALRDKLARARDRAWVDHAFFIGATAENVAELPQLERLAGCAGVKIFVGSSTGSLLVEEEDILEAILSRIRRRFSVHAEDEARLRERKTLVEGGAEVALHPEWRDATAALMATERVVRLCRKTGARGHILHISTAEEMAFLAEHKDFVTVEVTPQHLTLEAPEAYRRFGTLAQMNPPIRTGEDRAALWRAVDQGLVDVLGSDHAPHSLEEKQRPYPASPSGIPGVQTLLPLMLTHVNAGRLSLERLVDLTAAGPARVFNIAGKGRIAQGYDADLVLVDRTARREITADWLASKAGWTPFEGERVVGWPVMTLVRGGVVARDGVLLGAPQGAPVRFQETMDRAPGEALVT